MAKSPLHEKLRLMAAKAETTPGTAVSLTATDAVDLVSNLQFEFATEKATVEKPGAQAFVSGVHGVRSGSLKFRLGLSAESSAPRVAALYLAACGLGGAGGGVYQRDSLLPHASGSTAKTLTIGFYHDGVYRNLYGAMGNAIIHCLAGQATYIDFDFKGKYVAGDADLALLAPTFNMPALLRLGNASLAIDAYAPRVSKIDIDLGNKVELLEDANAADGSGVAFAYIDGFETILSMDPEKCLVADHPFYANWEAGTTSAISFSLLSGSAEAAFAISAGEPINLRDGARRNVSIYDLGYRDNDADLSITFTPTGS